MHLCQFLIGTVLQIIKQGKESETKQHVSIPHRYGITLKRRKKMILSKFNVSIPHRYGITTVFSTFSHFFFPQKRLFSPVFLKKVGLRFFSPSPETLDFQGFFDFLIFILSQTDFFVNFFLQSFSNFLLLCSITPLFVQIMSKKQHLPPFIPLKPTISNIFYSKS